MLVYVNIFHGIANIAQKYRKIYVSVGFEFRLYLIPLMIYMFKSTNSPLCNFFYYLNA